MSATLSRTTRMPYGVTNASPRQTLSNAGFLDPTFAALIALDYINANDLTALPNLAGSALMAQAAGIGGQASQTSGAVANTISAASTPAVFQINGKRIFMKWSGQVDSLLGTLFVGFFVSASLTSHGVFITSSTAGALTLNVIGAGGTQTFPFPAACVLAAATPIELGIEIDEQSNVFAYWNPTTGAINNQDTVGAVTFGTTGNGNPNGPVVSAYNQLNGQLQGLTLPTDLLEAGFGVDPTTAAARLLTTDFFVAAQHR